MVYFEKSQPAPECLEIEKQKPNGDYKCGSVLKRLEADFKSKCYLCERAGLTAINVEHFRPHKGNKRLKFDWNNLFWSCSHCNNTKLDMYNNLLNCIDKKDDVENALSYFMESTPKEKVYIEIIKQSEKAVSTKELLLKVYNGTTELKTLEAANIRAALLEDLLDFKEHLKEHYKKSNKDEVKEFHLMKVKNHLSRSSNFTAFNRWIVKKNAELRNDLEQYFD